MMVDLAVAIPVIKDGKVKAFGVTSAHRVKAMPDLPTIAEAGLPGYGAAGWFSVVAPGRQRRGRSSTSSTACWWTSSTGRKPRTR